MTTKAAVHAMMQAACTWQVDFAHLPEQAANCVFLTAQLLLKHSLR
jgi:hypothetical protein